MCDREEGERKLNNLFFAQNICNFGWFFKISKIKAFIPHPLREIINNSSLTYILPKYLSNEYPNSKRSYNPRKFDLE